MGEAVYYKAFKKYLKKAGISIAEWHSIIIGVSTAILAGPGTAVTVYTGVTAVKKRKLESHMKDLREEIAYFLVSFLMTEGLLRLVTQVHLL